jgi:hypothetical protein
VALDAYRLSWSDTTGPADTILAQHERRSALPHPDRPPPRRQQGQLPLVEPRRALPAMPPQMQGKVKMERRWLHEHSDWFKPYVAGYYAHVYLNEDVTREQAEARMDELLALEQGLRDRATGRWSSQTRNTTSRSPTACPGRSTPGAGTGRGDSKSSTSTTPGAAPAPRRSSTPGGAPPSVCAAAPGARSTTATRGRHDDDTKLAALGP